MLIIDHSPVHSDPEVMSGVLVFTGTRVPAQTLFDYIDAGDTLAVFLEDFPSVNKEDAEFFLKLARKKNHS
jgi:uncharacterized protein (DUF433 family)